ncbi:MAG: hypothetical protein AAGA68_13990 [Pseudomonadota bacterium]
MHHIRRLTTGCLALLAAGAALATPTPEEGAILEVIDAFFLALHAGDADTLEAVLQPHSRTVLIRPDGEEGAASIAVREGRDTVARMRHQPWAPFRESYWSPKVLQRGRLAVVWLPYVLIREEGGFSHCGIDQFTLTKAGGWRIDFVAFTIEPTREACADLGQPSDDDLLRPTFPEQSK